MELQKLSTNSVPRFEAACARIHAILEESRPLVSTEFSKLPLEEQERVLLMAEATASCAEQMIAEKLSPFDAGKLSWRVLSFMGLRPDSAAYTLYQPGDVIEVYNSAHKQIFASLNFLKLSAYPLDTLYSRPWTELWTRPSDSILQTLWGTMCHVFDNPSQGTQTVALDPYVVTENLSGRQAIIRCRGFSPVAEARAGRYAVLSVNEIIQVIPSA